MPEVEDQTSFHKKENTMISQLSTRNANARYIILVGALVLLLAASFPLAAAAGASDVSYSGDDAYDPAAGGLSASESPSESISLVQTGLAFSGGYSGDDAYDPAAGGLFGSFSFADASDECDDASGIALVGTFSGDDAYDPAAGGIPNSSLMALACAVPGLGIQ
jgi:hypothetical protein